MKIRDARESVGSPYVRSHADNPVDWWTWGDDALAEAIALDRPIFLSIGYAACHWCHVMAHESFEDPAIAAILNESFISIKVDREERPDIDAIYMAATQMMSGSGGWPMSIFCLPDTRPFMAGTYYPPVDRAGQIGFARLASTIGDAWRTRRDEVVTQAQRVSSALAPEIAFVDRLAPHTERIDLATIRQRLRDELVSRSDPRDGGFGGAPKFPRPSYIDALVRFDDADARRSVEVTLDAMARRGLYDHLRGGFARYSVDATWHVPHFEKMLSDQALLARTYLLASRRRPDRSWWREVALDTINFVLEDLDTGAGFASSLDADAAGVEGSHITWTSDEVVAALGDAEVDVVAAALERWRLRLPGEFEGRSIPRLDPGAPFRTPDGLLEARAALRASRARRVQPARDDKIVLEWNAMFAATLVRSGVADLQGRGLDLLRTLGRTHLDSNVWWRTQHRTSHATASDVAWLLDATVDAFELTGVDEWLIGAGELATYLVAHYWDGDVPRADRPDSGEGLFLQSDLSSDLIARPKEIFDGATPSSHAVACRAFARYALCSDDLTARLCANRLVEMAATLMVEHPTAVPDLIEAAGFALEGVQVVIPGDDGPLSQHLRSLAVFDTVLITGSGTSPLLRDRLDGRAYVCQGSLCHAPVDSLDALTRVLAEASH